VDILNFAGGIDKMGCEPRTEFKQSGKPASAPIPPANIILLTQSRACARPLLSPTSGQGLIYGTRPTALQHANRLGIDGDQNATFAGNAAAIANKKGVTVAPRHCAGAAAKMPTGRDALNDTTLAHRDSPAHCP
jgi:hypothetical protein